MTPEELLKPRYKVIADYPGNEFKLDEIFILNQIDDRAHLSKEYFMQYTYGNVYHESFFNKYPHLFKKLEWWEERKESNMPEYVKNIKTGKISKVISVSIVNGTYTAKINGVALSIYLPTFLPATKEEYENQKD